MQYSGSCLTSPLFAIDEHINTSVIVMPVALIDCPSSMLVSLRMFVLKAIRNEGEEEEGMRVKYGETHIDKMRDEMEEREKMDSVIDEGMSHSRKVASKSVS